jgi:glycosyltransferase involved in cell wall biosynthesis
VRSLARLKRVYRRWTASGWTPDVIMVCNFSPVYNAFVRWLRSQAGRPRLLLYLADSVDLQRRLSLGKRVRYALKPLRWLDSDMVRFYDACVAVSRDTEEFFVSRGYPWLWLPNGCDAARAVREGGSPPADGLRFGYFGTLAPHGGLDRLIEVFRTSESNAQLHVCGWGKKKEEIAGACARDSRLKFLGVKTPDECVRFTRDCDVMVNPRPIVPGNENNFSSKVFEYALGGRAILTSRLSGVDAILGPEAFYFDAENFDASLREALAAVAAFPRQELHRRGTAVQDRMLSEFSWERQGERLRNFVYQLAG